MRCAYPAKAPVHNRPHGFVSKPASPTIFANEPADLVIALIRRIRMIHALDSDMGDKLTSVLLDPKQERKTLLRIKRHVFGVFGLDLVQFLDPAQMLHNRRRVQRPILEPCIAFINGAKDEALCLKDYVSHEERTIGPW